jgi:hypothetical protein
MGVAVATILLALHARPAGQAPKATGTGVLSQIVVDGQAADVPVDWKRHVMSLTAVPGTAPISERPGTWRPTDDGHFTIANLTPGQHSVTIGASSGPAPQVMSVTIGGQALAGGEIEIQAGTNVENVAVRIKNP